MYSERAGLGDVTSEIVDGLTRLRNLATNVQQGGDALAAQIAQAGDFAVRLSNAATGAAAGAKAGYSAPATSGEKFGTAATLGLVVLGVVLLSRGKR